MTNSADLYPKNEGLLDVLRSAYAVADTSVLLNRGTDLLRSMPKGSKLVIPAVVVGELESKREQPANGFLAREWLRLLEELRRDFGTDLSSRDGVYEDGVNISVEPNHTDQAILPIALRNGSNDSTILAVAKALSEEYEERVVILSNDLPMRLHATLELNLEAFEISALTLDSAAPFSGLFSVEIPDEHVNDTVNGSFALSMLSEEDQDKLDEQTHAVVSVCHNGTVLSRFVMAQGRDDLHSSLDELPRSGNRVMDIAPKTFEQHAAAVYLKKNPHELPIVSIGGGAGTGKTLLAVAAGLQAVKDGHYTKVIVFRSLHEMGVGQEMGFLPGGVDEKIAPWAGAVFDAVDVIARGSENRGRANNVEATVEDHRKNIEVSPISYLRGRSITDSYMILDEAQNFSRKELLNIISRVGFGTKVVLCFDADQVDSKYLQSGSRADIWSLVHSLKTSELFAHVTLKRTERSVTAELASSLLAG